MQYRTLTEAQYAEAMRRVLIGAEGLHPTAMNVGDDMATIGYGYTLNRNNNVALWTEAGIALTDSEKAQLRAIDAADKGSRTELGLAFKRPVAEVEADRLLLATYKDYEQPAVSRGMPLSEERVAVVSVTYNRNPSIMRNHDAMVAIDEGRRADAWYELRYECWGSLTAGEAGLRKRRITEANAFGLYDNADSPSMADAESAYRMFRERRENIDAIESRFGVRIDGASGDRNVIAEANRDYPAMVERYGAVPTIREALEPARQALLPALREAYPEHAAHFSDERFWSGQMGLNPEEIARFLQVERQERDRLNEGQLTPIEIQRTLRVGGFTDSANRDITPDGDFGRRSVEALKIMQQSEGLPATGELDAATRLRLSVRHADQEAQASSLTRASALSAPAIHELGHPDHGRYLEARAALAPHRDSLGMLEPEARATASRLATTAVENGHRNIVNVEISADGSQITLPSAALPVTKPVDLPRDALPSSTLPNGFAPPQAQAPDLRNPSHPGHAAFNEMQHRVAMFEANNGIPAGPHSEQLAAAILQKAVENKVSYQNVYFHKDADTGRVQMVERRDPQVSAEESRRFDLDLRTMSSQSVDVSSQRLNEAVSQHYAAPAQAQAVTRSPEQARALAGLSFDDQVMFGRIRREVPGHIDDAHVAQAMTAAKQNGMPDAASIGGVMMLGDRVRVMGTGEGAPVASVDVTQPAPKIETSIANAHVLNEQHVQAQQVTQEAQAQQQSAALRIA